MGVPPNAEEMARALSCWWSRSLTRLLVRARAAVSIVFRSPPRPRGLARIWLFVTILWPLFSPVLANAVTSAGIFWECWILSRRLRDCPLRCCSTRCVAVVLIRRCARPAIDARRHGSGLDRARCHPGRADLAAAKRTDRLAADRRLVAGSILLFVIGYIVFQRQEVRA